MKTIAKILMIIVILFTTNVGAQTNEQINEENLAKPVIPKGGYNPTAIGYTNFLYLTKPIKVEPYDIREMNVLVNKTNKNGQQTNEVRNFYRINEKFYFEGEYSNSGYLKIVEWVGTTYIYPLTNINNNATTVAIVNGKN
ncbi:MAG: hypothetical protein WCS89_01400 [Candidatus Paceibacterota bacterium]|jgi:hypothetical protein